ncbi:uncharacterized protein BJX67DRAFT_351851 [Aspergillus lucknowensis]|uniref:Uncharacterized protein n=1 Tax=Aspergillus lucknowensis TaxID=176173 RepID=A0ABR4LTX2_9EURO
MERKEQKKMHFATQRPKSSLLIPSKRPLSTPSPTRCCSHSSSCSSVSWSTSQPTLRIRSLDADAARTDQEKEKEQRRIEVDFSAAPQPFLDPELWGRMQRGEGMRE